jgi:surface antigen
MMMRAHSSQLFTAALGALAVLSSAAVEAQGLFSLGRSLSELSAADREATTRARTEVLEKLQAGAVSAWSDGKTGHSGEVGLRRVYEKNGMACGDVEYILKIPDTKRYRAVFCRGGDGTWRAEG